MRSIAIVITLCLFCSFAFAQPTTLVSGNFQNTPLKNVIDDIELKSGCHFYYVSAWLDSIRVTASFDQVTIKEALGKVLSNTLIHNYIKDNKVVLTLNSPVIEQIDPALFSGTATASSWNYSFQREIVSQDQGVQQEVIKEIGSKGVTKSAIATLSGYVRDKRSGETITGATVNVAGTNRSTITDQYGFYSLEIPTGLQTVVVKFIGQLDINQQVMMYSTGRLNFVMEEKINMLKEIVVASDQAQHVSSTQMGVSKIDISSLKNVPKVLGENDVFKVILTLPGVKSVGEGAAGINVRGGNADQNLVLINEATVYNTSHFLGFFSVFNADGIKSFEMYKSGIPAKHGGRLASIFDIQLKDGNQKKFSGQGGIGPITSHLSFEIPLKKEKTSLMFGGRSTYSGWVLNQVPNRDLKRSKASFYDVFARITHNLNDKNSIYLSGYFSSDSYKLSNDSVFSYTNLATSLQWRHIFTDKHSAVFSLTNSQYRFGIDYTTLPVNAFKLGFDIQESHMKWDFNLTKNKHQIDYGLDSKLFTLNPGKVSTASAESIIQNKSVQSERGLESALYVSDNFEITPSLTATVGLRLSMFNAMGPRRQYQYTPGQPRDGVSIIDTLFYPSNKVFKTYGGPEYRVAFRYRVLANASVKLSYNRTRQYIHMLSNTVSVTPTNTWKLSDINIAPQLGDQIAIGYYQDLFDQKVEFTIEGYRKWLNNVLDYKTGSVLLMNQNIEQDVLQGQGKAYGVEILLKKKTGKLNGWIAYTYSRTFLKFDGKSPSETINGGKYFPANYDKPHDVSVVMNYKITRRYSFSSNLLYTTGRPITYPISVYRFENGYRVNYSDRNAYRIPDYFRIDIGFNIEGNHKVKKLSHGFWSVSVYNVLGRKNPYSIFFKVEDGQIHAYKLSIFGAPIPTITYNFKF